MSTMNEMDELSGWALTAESQPELFPGVAEDATRTPETVGVGRQPRRQLQDLSDDERRQMVAQHRAGVGFRAIGEELNMSFRGVREALQVLDPDGDDQPGAVPLPEVETIVGDQYHGDGADDLPVSAVGERPEPVAATSGATGAVTALVTAEVLQARRATTPEELPVGPEREVFTHSEATRAVWHAARARGASPWGTLGYVMAHTAAATGPHLRLPPIVGGEVAMNMLVGMVGRPSKGKGKARSVARDLFVYANHAGVRVDVYQGSIGSGEGIPEKFKVRTRNGDDGDGTEYQETDRALFDSTEISDLAQKTARTGSTLLPMLCKAFMGENLGNDNGTAESSRMVPDHTYRMCLTIGIQPERSRVLLKDAEAGTPQRFLWLPVPYPGRPDAEDTPDTPEEFTIRLPFGTIHGTDPMHVSLPERVVWEIRRADVENSRNEYSDGLDGHLLLTREKVAVALALMGGSTTVTDADWSAAGAIIDMSVRTREKCEEACKGAAVEAAAARRIEDAEGKDQAAEHMAKTYAATVRKRVLTLLTETTGTLFSDLRNQMNGKALQDGRSQKDRLPEVLSALVGEGLILESKTMDGHDKETMEYRLSRQ